MHSQINIAFAPEKKLRAKLIEQMREIISTIKLREHLITRNVKKNFTDRRKKKPRNTSSTEAFFRMILNAGKKQEKTGIGREVTAYFVGISRKYGLSYRSRTNHVNRFVSM